MQTRLVLILLLAVAGSFQMVAAEPRPVTPQPRVDLYVVLDNPPAFHELQNDRKKLANAATTGRQAGFSLLSKQARLQSQLETKGARITGRFTRLINAMRISLPADQVEAVASMPGVKKVARTRHYERHLVRAAPYVGAVAAWRTSPSPVDGSKIRIGIIDSGIDYTHADFGGSGRVSDFLKNDPTLIEPGSFPTPKVVGGYDFAGDSYNASDPLHWNPLPDPDPIDRIEEGGHGTHVAGVAAGFGVLTNGTTYQGAYTNQLDMQQFKIAPGIAPRALLYALKIFGTNGTTDLVVDALEWAADPNGDFDFSDRLDVVTLSLGTSFGTDDPEDPELAAIGNLVQLGCVVVCSAGNDGNNFYAASTPGTAASALTVGNSVHLADRNALQVLQPASLSLANVFPMEEGIFTFPLADSGPIEGPVVYVEPNNACAEITNSGAFAGKIALIDRGGCFFTDKVQRAQDAGAIAVIMVNNVDGNPIIMAGENPAIFIPGVMISKAAGDLLKAHLKENLTVRLGVQFKVVLPELLDNISDSSSRGPVGLTSLLKPEIVAPGVSINSASAGAGTEGKDMSGTSVSAPFVSGAAALLRQLHPDWTVGNIKAALMNTAQTTHNAQWVAYPESLVGAGRLQVDEAMRLQVTAAAAQAEGGVALSFGPLEFVSSLQTNRTILLSNHGTNSVTFQVAVSNTVAQSGIRLVPEAASITVPARGTATLQVTLFVDPVPLQLSYDSITPQMVGSLARHRLFEFSGQVWFQHTNQSLHLPFHAVLRHATEYQASTNTIVLDVTEASQKQVNVTVPLQGPSIPTNSLLSAFECGVILTNDPTGMFYTRFAQLLAAGAASDVATTGSLESSRVFFGLATAQSWPTPQSSYVILQVLVDTNHDQIADYLISNDNATSTNGSPETADVFVTLVHQLDDQGYPRDPIASGPLNIFPPNELDAPLFNSSVMILSVMASQIGLSSNHSRFLYQVQTVGEFQSISATDWIDFDAAHPALDTTINGFQGTPFHLGNLPVAARLDREAAFNSRPSPPRLLVLYHHNRVAQRMEAINLDWSRGDQDQDGLEDWWELSHFPNLSEAGANTDHDRDGFSDIYELKAGTDPANARSYFTLLSILPQAEGALAVRWSSAAGKYYSILASTNLLSKEWSILASHQFAAPPENVYIVTNRFSQNAQFFQIRLDP